MPGVATLRHEEIRPLCRSKTSASLITTRLLDGSEPSRHSGRECTRTRGGVLQMTTETQGRPYLAPKDDERVMVVLSDRARSSAFLLTSSETAGSSPDAADIL